MVFLEIYLPCVIVGYILGVMKRQSLEWKYAKSQQERGDYWYDKYMMVVREDWEPFTEDLKEN